MREHLLSIELLMFADLSAHRRVFGRPLVMMVNLLHNYMSAIALYASRQTAIER